MFKTRKLKPNKPTLADFFADPHGSVPAQAPRRASDASPDENVAASIAATSIINS